MPPTSRTMPIKRGAKSDSSTELSRWTGTDTSMPAGQIADPRPSADNQHSTGAEGTFSVREELNDSVVLLTGATGYIGSLLLELILRQSPEVRKVYLLIRSKKGVQAEHRLDALLAGPVFCQHKAQDLKPKLQVIHADMTKPQCGLSDTECVNLGNVNYIIHCAAAIRFDMHVHDILKQTFVPTSTLLSIAAHMPGIRCFTFISTAFVNANLPKGTCIQERIYPLTNTCPIEDGEIAQYLLDLQPEAAAFEAQVLMHKNNLQNTYFLAKNLTERMVMARDGQPHRVCIIRPSIVGAVARTPCPGFIGNSSGFTAAILGAAAGIVTFAQHGPESVMTIVPGDMVAATTLATMTAHGRAAALEEPAPCSNIVHCCTSATYPINTHKLYLSCCTFLNEDPPKTGSMRQDFQVDWVQSNVQFWLRCIIHTIRIRMTALVLRMQGHARVSQRLNFAWERWRELASSEFDFNLTFLNTAAQTLEKIMDPKERAALKVTWHEEDGDSWLRYLRTYVAGARHLYRNEAPTIFDTQDYRPFISKI